MDKLWKIYHDEIPCFLKEFMNTPEMLRLKEVGMNCGLEYTKFPNYQNLRKYSRYTHSVGVALIIYHFTNSIKMSVAGLFHDIATPCFSHVVDFLNNDYLVQESTEEETRAIIESSKEIRKLLTKYELTVDDVYDYHLYPIADNDSPCLSADRLEYTLGNFYNHQNLQLAEIKEYYDNLVVDKDEKGQNELSFKDSSLAIPFTIKTLDNSRWYISDEDRYSMECLSSILKEGIKQNILTWEDLYQDEIRLIDKLEASPLKEQWHNFNRLEYIITSNIPKEGYLQIPAKKRYINPLVQGKGRVKDLDIKVNEEIEKFLDIRFDYWLKGY